MSLVVESIFLNFKKDLLVEDKDYYYKNSEHLPGWYAEAELVKVKPMTEDIFYNLQKFQTEIR